MKAYSRSWLVTAILTGSAVLMTTSFPQLARATHPSYAPDDPAPSHIALAGRVPSELATRSGGSTVYVDANNNTGMEDGTLPTPLIPSRKALASPRRAIRSRSRRALTTKRLPCKAGRCCSVRRK